MHEFIAFTEIHVQISVYMLFTWRESTYKLATTDTCKEISDLVLVSHHLVS